MIQLTKGLLLPSAYCLLLLRRCHMNRRALFLALTVITAALLFPGPSSARQMQRDTNVETPPQPPYPGTLPRPPHEAVSLGPRAGETRRRAASLTKEDRRLLAAPREDEELHADFLSQSDTGLIRLLPRGVYDKQLSLRGGGAYYSFDVRTHEYNYGSDIQLQRGDFLVGFAGADFGFMVALGDAPLENVSTETDAVRFMASYETPAAEPEARAAYRRFAHGEGHREGAWTYKSR